MPYIIDEKRDILEPALDELLDAIYECGLEAGNINYVITRIIHDYLSLQGVSYATLNEIMGILESAKQEFYRRKVAPYEDKKIEENGDV